MVYTTLLEPYNFPKLIPVEVTVLRGSRRLRLSSALRRRYADFVPKIWHLMAKLGYQKYLQKIYVAIESDVSLTSPYYQLPVVIAVLNAVGMLRLHQDIHALGRFLADYTLAFPFQDTKTDPQATPATLFTTKLEEYMRLEQFLNKLHTEPIAYTDSEFDLHDLFPGVAFTPERYIDFGATPIDVLKRISVHTLQEKSLYISLRHKPLSELKVAILQRLSLSIPIQVEYKECFCGKRQCICTKTDKQQHQYQIDLLKNLHH